MAPFFTETSKACLASSTTTPAPFGVKRRMARGEIKTRRADSLNEEALSQYTSILLVFKSKTYCNTVSKRQLLVACTTQQVTCHNPTYPMP
jgi:hypothetical protein